MPTPLPAEQFFVDHRPVAMYVYRSSLSCYRAPYERLHTSVDDGFIGWASWRSDARFVSIADPSYRGSGLAMTMLAAVEEAAPGLAVGDDLTCEGAFLINRYNAIHHPDRALVQPRKDRLKECKRAGSCAFYGDGSLH